LSGGKCYDYIFLLKSLPGIFLLIDNCNHIGYNHIVIKTFRHKGLENFFFDGSKKGIHPEHAKKLGLILDRLDASNTVQDMNYPGSGLHLLKGNLSGYWAVTVSGNWRVVFQFHEGDAYVVDYRDYH